MYNPILQNTIDRVKATDAKVFVPRPQGGRPPNSGSVTYWLRQILAENEGIKAYDLANKIIQQANDGSYPHQNIVLERIDGNVASEINVKGVVLHVGDEYASQGLAAMREDMSTKQMEASKMPQISNSSPANGQTGIPDRSDGKDAIISDE